MDFDFISRLTGATNQINLQIPEFAAATNYGLRISTSAGSTSHAFTALLTTNVHNDGFAPQWAGLDALSQDENLENFSSTVADNLVLFQYEI